MPDTLLTPKGIAQCKEVASTFPPTEIHEIELLAASPLRRATYTAIHAFPDVTKRGLKILALPEAQETGAGLKPCDTGSDLDMLMKEFHGHPVDLSLVSTGWNARHDHAADSEAFRARGLIVRRWLKDRKENVICLVTHGGFLHYLTEDWNGFDEKRGTAWANCEWRTYEFKDTLNGSDDHNATLVEFRESRARRLEHDTT